MYELNNFEVRHKISSPYIERRFLFSNENFGFVAMKYILQNKQWIQIFLNIVQHGSILRLSYLMVVLSYGCLISWLSYLMIVLWLSYDYLILWLSILWLSYLILSYLWDLSCYFMQVFIYMCAVTKYIYLIKLIKRPVGYYDYRRHLLIWFGNCKHQVFPGHDSYENGVLWILSCKKYLQMGLIFGDSVQSKISPVILMDDRLTARRHFVQLPTAVWCIWARELVNDNRRPSHPPFPPRIPHHLRSWHNCPKPAFHQE